MFICCQNCLYQQKSLLRRTGSHRSNWYLENAHLLSKTFSNKRNHCQLIDWFDFTSFTTWFVTSGCTCHYILKWNIPVLRQNVNVECPTNYHGDSQLITARIRPGLEPMTFSSQSGHSYTDPWGCDWNQWRKNATVIKKSTAWYFTIVKMTGTFTLRPVIISEIQLWNKQYLPNS